MAIIKVGKVVFLPIFCSLIAIFYLYIALKANADATIGGSTTCNYETVKRDLCSGNTAPGTCKDYNGKMTICLLATQEEPQLGDFFCISTTNNTYCKSIYKENDNGVIEAVKATCTISYKCSMDAIGNCYLTAPGTIKSESAIKSAYPCP